MGNILNAVMWAAFGAIVGPAVGYALAPVVRAVIRRDR